MIDDLKPYPEYKDSGLPWLGEVPASWRLRRAKFLFREIDERSTTGKEELLSVSHKTGVTPRSQKTVTMFLAKSNVGHKICRPQDLVINTLWAWMAALGVSRHTGIVSPAYGVYRPLATDQLLPGFADLLLRTPAYAAEYQRRSTGVNSSRLRLYPEDFLRVPVLLPSVDEQAAIVRFLDWANGRLERAIRAKRKVIALLNEQKLAIISSLVTGKCEVGRVKGEDGDDSHFTPRPSHLMKPSGIPWLGDIPQHWEVRKLKFEMAFRGGGTPSKGNPAYWRGTIPWVSPKDMKFEIIHDAEDHITERAVAESSTNLVPSGSLLVVVRSGILQRAIPAARCSREVALNQDMKALTSKGRLGLDYFMLFIRGCEKQLLREWTKQGATVESIEHQYLANTKVPIPPLVEQKCIAEQLADETAPLTNAISRFEREIALLREYRTRLVSDVVTGKLDVRSVKFEDGSGNGSEKFEGGSVMEEEENYEDEEIDDE